MPHTFTLNQTNILVNRLEDFTVPWAQHIVKRYAQDARVSKLDIVSVDIGTTTRVRLAVEHDGPAALARRWFVKMPSLALRAKLITALPRLLHTETRFYLDVAEAVPFDKPTLLAAQRRLGKGATLVFSDLTERGAAPGRPDDALTLQQAAAVVERLARFHAGFWGSPQNQTYRWLDGPVRRLEDALGTLLAVPLMNRGLYKAGALIPDHLHRGAQRYARRRRHVMKLLNSNPQTLIHRDCHPGNFFWNGSQPGLLDWQLVRIGEGIADVAYFLATALTPELRREHERSLLNLYRQILKAHGAVDWNMDSLWERYRLHLCYPFEAMVVTLAVGGMMDLHSNLELIRRTTAAVSDLDVFAAL
ncbi:MAG: phosphotransferase [Gammaproteobacteria bacterium]